MDWDTNYAAWPEPLSTVFRLLPYLKYTAITAMVIGFITIHFLWTFDFSAEEEHPPRPEEQHEDESFKVAAASSRQHEAESQKEAVAPENEAEPTQAGKESVTHEMNTLEAKNSDDPHKVTSIDWDKITPEETRRLEAKILQDNRTQEGICDEVGLYNEVREELRAELVQMLKELNEEFGIPTSEELY